MSRPPPGIPSEFMHFPGKPQDLATKAHPMAGRQTAMSLLPGHNQLLDPEGFLWTFLLQTQMQTQTNNADPNKNIVI